MLKKYYFIILALKGYRLISIKRNVVASINLSDKRYYFWYYERPYKKLIQYDSCDSVDEARFKWNILIKEVVD